MALPPDPKNYTLAQLEEQVLIMEENMHGFFLCTIGTIASLMQIGYGYVEAGTINAKNATNAIFKNVSNSLLCGIMLWLVGYTLAYGEGSSFMGIYYYQGGKDLSAKKHFAPFFFHLSYAAIPSMIVSGAVVDRITIIGHFALSAFMSGVVYPIVCHWAWTDEGWLTVLGFKDFAGSAVIHVLGGSCAIAAAVILGPRINRFPKPGYEHTPEEKVRFSHHNAVMTGLGGMILYTSYFAFNGGSLMHINRLGDGEMVGKLLTVTWLGSSGGAFGTLILIRTGIVDGKPRWSFLKALIAGLSGMISTSAHCDQLDMWSGFLSGLCASVVFCCVLKLLDKLQIDDPISCIPLHFGGGLWGAIGSSMLRQDSFVGGYGTRGGYYLAYQIAGTLAIILWGWACMIVLLGGLRLLRLLRVSPEDELRGADATQHKEQAYIGIMCRCEYLRKKHDMDIHTVNTGDGYDKYNASAHGSTETVNVQEIGDSSQYGLSFRHNASSLVS